MFTTRSLLPILFPARVFILILQAVRLLAVQPLGHPTRKTKLNLPKSLVDLDFQVVTRTTGVDRTDDAFPQLARIKHAGVLSFLSHAQVVLSLFLPAGLQYVYPQHSLKLNMI